MACGRSMDRPDGVNQRAVVILTPPPEPVAKIPCALPFPNVVRPMTTARSWSCSAPATISDALALPASTSTTSGRFGHCCCA